MGPPGPHQSLLSSAHIKLNGALLAVSEAGDVPAMPGKPSSSGLFSAPPRTYGFVVYPKAGANACTGGVPVR